MECLDGMGWDGVFWRRGLGLVFWSLPLEFGWWGLRISRENVVVVLLRISRIFFEFGDPSVPNSDGCLPHCFREPYSSVKKDGIVL